MIGTTPVDINEFNLANTNFAIVEYINREDSSHSSVVPFESTSYRERKTINSEVYKRKRLSSLSGLFDFQKLDADYFKEKGV